VAALVLPVLLVLFGVLFPLGVVDPPSHAEILGVLRNPLTRLGLIVVSALSLAHAAHRLRFTLEDGLRLKRYDALITAACYGGALLGTVAAAYLLLAVL
jgi:fumarate reductase subunit D